LTKGEESHEGF